MHRPGKKSVAIVTARRDEAAQVLRSKAEAARFGAEWWVVVATQCILRAPAFFVPTRSFAAS